MRTCPCILVTEDEPLLALELETFLGENGYEVAGPYPSVATTLEQMPTLQIACAELDVNLRGELVLPIAERLSEAGIPFVFLTGHSQNHIPQRYRDRPFLNKPFDRTKLLNIVRRLVPKPIAAA
ncbi:MAG: response regulator [Pseudomonadota bacterium]|nr:response regulator [Pseudomonadota bacterium]